MRTSTRPARRAAVIVATGTVLGLAVAGGQGTAAGAGTGPPAAAGAGLAASAGWRVVFRSASAQSNQIRAVAALSSRDAWAVGATARSGGPEDHPLALRWNGRAWRPATVPGVAGFALTDVAASSRSDLWIFAVPGHGGRARAVRWDGTRWRAIGLPSGVLPDDVAVLSPANAWVVGPQRPCTGAGAGRVCPTTMYHWNGSTWTASRVPIVVDQLSGSALAASPSGRIWVAGALRPCGGPSCSYRVAVYRWTGSGWARAPGFPRVTSAFLPALAVASASSVWVGTWSVTKENPGRLLHWAGRGWRTISAPRSLTTATPLVTDGRSGVWMGPWAHWTGTRWTSTLPGSAPACQPQALARVPGRTTLWGGGSVTRSPGSPAFTSVICAYPRAPRL
jgi:hypothetical protein